MNICLSFPRSWELHIQVDSCAVPMSVPSQAEWTPGAADVIEVLQLLCARVAWKMAKSMRQAGGALPLEGFHQKRDLGDLGFHQRWCGTRRRERSLSFNLHFSLDAAVGQSQGPAWEVFRQPWSQVKKSPPPAVSSRCDRSSFAARVEPRVETGTSARHCGRPRCSTWTCRSCQDLRRSTGVRPSI